MAEKKYSFSLPMKAPRNTYIKNINLVEADVGNVFEISLTYNDEPYDFNDLIPILTCKKEDETIVVSEGNVIDATKGLIEFPILSQTISYPGKVVGAVQFREAGDYEIGDKRITSSLFSFHVLQQVDDGSDLESTSDYDVLSTLLNVRDTEDARVTAETQRVADHTLRMTTIDAKITELEGVDVTQHNNRLLGLEGAFKNPFTSDVIETGSIIDLNSKYLYSKMISDISYLVQNHGDKLETEVIGTSVMGKDIPVLRLGNLTNPTHQYFIMATSHAREYHNTPLLMKQIELYLANWDKTINGVKISDVFADSVLHIVPCHNPDGMMICQEGTSVLDSNLTKKTFVENAIRDYIRTGNIIIPGDVDEGHDFGVGDLATYTYRDNESVIWKANVDGIDLHYNFVEAGVNAELIDDYIKNNTPQAPTVGYYYGDRDGGDNIIVAQETQVVMDYINSKGINKFASTWHGRMPAVFWNFDLPKDVYEQNRNIAHDIADITGTPSKEGYNNAIGFVGWYTKKYANSFCCNIETGYSTWNSQVDACPIDLAQMPTLWEQYKFIPLYILQKYITKIATSGLAGKINALQTDMLKNKALLSGIHDSEVDVIDYGADPTGVEDSTRAFEQALLTGKKVRAIGTFKVSTVLNIPANAHLVGAGIDKTVIIKDNTNTNPIFYIEGSNVIISDLTIKHDLTYGEINNSGLRGIRVSSASNYSDLVFRNLKIENCHDAIQGNNVVNNCIIDNVEINNFVSSAIELNNSATTRGSNVIIQNIKCDNSNNITTDSIIHIDNFDNIDVLNVMCKNVNMKQKAIEVVNCKNVEIDTIYMSGISASNTTEDYKSFIRIETSNVIINNCIFKANDINIGSYNFYGLFIKENSNVIINNIELVDPVSVTTGTYVKPVYINPASTVKHHNFILGASFDNSGIGSVGDLVVNRNIVVKNKEGTSGYMYYKNDDADGHREELGIRARDDAYQSGSNGAGINIYGNNDAKHPGALTILTGEDNNGDAALAVTKSHRVIFGTGIYGRLDNTQKYEADPNDVTIELPHNNIAHGQVSIMNPEGKPGLYITGANSSEGEIAVRYSDLNPSYKETLRLGHWNIDNNTFKSALELQSDGDVIVSTADKGIILKSPNGTQYRLVVSDGGALTTEAP